MKDFVQKVFFFYRDGFKGMQSLGKTLWLLIFVKLFIMFFILRLLFFPNFINTKAHSSAEKDDFVSSELIRRVPQ